MKEKKFCDLGLEKNFLDMTPKALKNTNKFDFIKTKDVYFSKDSVKGLPWWSSG